MGSKTEMQHPQNVQWRTKRNGHPHHSGGDWMICIVCRILEAMLLSVSGEYQISFMRANGIGFLQKNKIKQYGYLEI
jgi:hypothetical protein